MAKQGASQKSLRMTLSDTSFFTSPRTAPEGEGFNARHVVPAFPVCYCAEIFFKQT